MPEKKQGRLRGGSGPAVVVSLTGDTPQSSAKNYNCNARDHGQVAGFAEAWLISRGVRANLAGVVAELFGLGGRAV